MTRLTPQQLLVDIDKLLAELGWTRAHLDRGLRKRTRPVRWQTSAQSLPRSVAAIRNVADAKRVIWYLQGHVRRRQHQDAVQTLLLDLGWSARRLDRFLRNTVGCESESLPRSIAAIRELSAPGGARVVA